VESATIEQLKRSANVLVKELTRHSRRAAPDAVRAGR
jgi:hypothetical protein